MNHSNTENLLPSDQAFENKSEANTPLIVDLDGTLTQTDLLYESYFASITNGLGHHGSTIAALLQGKAQLKAHLARAGSIDYETLPYNHDILQLIREAKQRGREVYLATASDHHHAQAIAKHLGLFDGIFASDGFTNLSGTKKAGVLTSAFGEFGFDYVGNHEVDLQIWAHARKAYILSSSESLLRKVNLLGKPVKIFPKSKTTFRTWRKALRVHQYSKNALVFVPLVTAHVYTLHSFVSALFAFISFSLCASSVYLLNDLVDLRDDRKHPTKRFKPFASGSVSLVQGMLAMPMLLVAAFVCASSVSLMLAGTLLGYFVLTLSYSLSLKRKLIVDIVVLATLYTVRVIAGAVAISVAPSEWLLAFSMLIFTCLALVKRYVELAMRIDKELPDPSNRNYRLIDLPIVGALASASGFNAVTIFALYVSSPAVQGLYRRPDLLWLICPVLLYWISRIVILAHRRVINDDPIVFALRDRNSLIAGVCMFAIVFVAS